MLNPFLCKKQKKMPNQTGVYYFSNANNEILYIGKAKNLKKRTSSYFKLDTLNKRLKKMIFEACDINFHLTQTEFEAFLLESQLIKEKKPLYNIQYKNGRAYSYIVFTKHDYAQIKIVKDWQKDAVGPFLSYSNLKQIIQDLLSIFQLRTCSNFVFDKRKRPCLEYYSKKCSAPCVKLINQDEYLKNTIKMKNLFYGKNKNVIIQLNSELKEAIKCENFELAAKIKNNICFLNEITQKQGIFFNDVKSLDIVLFYKKIFYLESIKNGAITNIEYRIYEKQITPEEILSQYYMEDSNIKIIGEKEIDFNKYTSNLSQKEKNILLHTKNRFKKLLEEDSEKKQWSQILGLEKLEFIEAYDCSHYNSKNALCAMILETIYEESIKNKYKIWKFSEHTYNDLQILEEGLTKRGMKNLPDLILIDGGLNQLKIAKKVLFPFNNIIAFAKGPNRKGGIIYNYNENILNINNNNLLMFLEKLRTNVHNWAKNNAQKFFTNDFIKDI